jgi:hypothetical protein
MGTLKEYPKLAHTSAQKKYLYWLSFESPWDFQDLRPQTSDLRTQTSELRTQKIESRVQRREVRNKGKTQKESPNARGERQGADHKGTPKSSKDCELRSLAPWKLHNTNKEVTVETLY